MITKYMEMVEVYIFNSLWLLNHFCETVRSFPKQTLVGLLWNAVPLDKQLALSKFKKLCVFKQ